MLSLICPNSFHNVIDSPFFAKVPISNCNPWCCISLPLGKFTRRWSLVHLNQYLGVRRTCFLFNVSNKAMAPIRIYNVGRQEETSKAKLSTNHSSSEKISWFFHSDKG